MASFLNPNNPTQPQAGVYGWFMTRNGKSLCLYIGEAGKRRTAKEKGTLLRGVTELCRETFSSDGKFRKLDTDFVLGTAIRFFEARGWDVAWQHISDNPTEEKRLLLQHHPLLQKASVPLLLPQLLVTREPGYWNSRDANGKPDLGKARAKMAEAEGLVFEELKKLFSTLITTGLS